MVTNLSESQIQEILCANVDLIESGLTFLKKEQYIPNDLGTRGFIDIYARDKNGKHVLIELKKSNASSREAIHEIYKYLEGVKSHFSAREDEIRVIVASTVWSELIVPFSRFYHESSIDTLGLQLEFINQSDVRATKVEILDFSEGRMFAPWYEGFWYLDKTSLKCGIDSIKKSCKKLELNDFIIVVVKVPSSFAKDEQDRVESALTTLFGSSPRQIPQVKLFQYLVFLAHQRKSKEFYLRQIEKYSKNLFVDTEELCANPDTQTIYDNFAGLLGLVECDYLTIENPAKFSEKLHFMGFRVLKLIKAGTFGLNQCLTDDTLLNEIETVDSKKFSGKANLSIKSEAAYVKRRVENCLRNNPPWKNHVLSIINELIEDKKIVEINISNLSLGILGIYLSVHYKDPTSYLPYFSINVIDSDEDISYQGMLEAHNPTKGFRHILDKYYNGVVANIVCMMMGDHSDDRHVDILFDLGLSYKTYKVRKYNNERRFERFEDFRWVVCESKEAIESFVYYLHENQSMVRQIYQRINAYHKGALVEPIFSHTMILKQCFDIDCLSKIDEKFIGSPPDCECCESPLADETFFVDGPFKNNSSWAMFCLDCFTAHGDGYKFASVFTKYGEEWVSLRRLTDNI
ncbi:endonuclease NucS domain-containing protein [Catenovulum adriaticum]|uniref:Endonuclease NucS n=1 Tax=Catenovulum adriaticum TaxID=2984846 RepID=A0ABY7AKW3_9ALTE|nr:endonuclease NucS domain-containing protein [Catenovulum sp. TS8]WAJ70203.1 endonuclease NucS [Catenovulum sp. TS8]